MTEEQLIKKYPHLIQKIAEAYFDVAEEKNWEEYLVWRKKPIGVDVSKHVTKNFSSKSLTPDSKEFQILTFVDKSGSVCTLRDNGCYVWSLFKPEDCPDKKGATLSEMLGEGLRGIIGQKIYTVKQIRTGRIFTIGNTVSTWRGNHQIESFKICGDVLIGEQIQVRFKKCSYKCNETVLLQNIK